MKNIILINLFSSFFIFCQSIPNKSEYFLLDMSRLDNLDKKTSNLIKGEIKKMKSDIKNQLIVNYKIEKSQDRITKREVVGYKFPNKQAEDRYVSALLSMNNPTQYEADYLKQQFQTPIYRTRVVQDEKKLTEFKKIPIDKITFTKRPGWSEVVDFYGGYANLVSKNINKEDLKSGKFDISAKLTVIEFINDRECLAYVEITGDLNLNGVSKSIYKYKGSYKIEDLNIFNLYKQNLPNVVMTFNDKKYLGATNEIRKPISSFVSEGNILINLKTTIDIMFDDLVSDEVFSNIDEIKNIKNNIEKKRIAEAKREKERRIAEAKREERKRIAGAKYQQERRIAEAKREKERRIAEKRNRSLNASAIYFSIGNGNTAGIKREGISDDLFDNGYKIGIGLLGILDNNFMDLSANLIDYDRPDGEFYAPYEGVYGPSMLKLEDVYLGGFSFNFGYGYDLSLGKIPLRLPIGLGYQYSRIQVSGKGGVAWEEKISDFYYFIDIVNKRFNKLMFSLSLNKGINNNKKLDNITFKLGWYY